MPHIKAFLDLHPAVKIQLDVQSFGTNPDLDHDLVICRLKEDFDSIAHRGVKLKSYRMGIYASPEYIRTHPAISTFKDLEQHKAIIADFQRRQGSLEMNGGESISLANHNFVSDNLDALLYAAVSGMGLIYATGDYIKREIAAGQLVRVLPEVTSTERQLWAFYPKSEHMPLKTRLFLDFLKQQL
jgi:DNA-binding transcriptional LysR family regulator